MTSHLDLRFVFLAVSLFLFCLISENKAQRIQRGRSLYLHGNPRTVISHSNHLPSLQKLQEKREKSTKFSGYFDGSLLTSYDDKTLEKLANSIESKSELLSWETTWLSSGKRKTTVIKVKDEELDRLKSKPNRVKTFKEALLENKKRNGKRRRHRGRREVFGFDDRHFVPTNTIGQQEPFSCTVKISTGCTGILISPRHVLTAAHCVHNQTDYIEGLKDLKIGFMNTTSHLQWIDAHFVRISKGWVEGGNVLGPHYDYALIKLKQRHNRPFIKISPSNDETQAIGERLYFTSFEDDKPTNTLWYRSCSIEDEDGDFLYHFCDARRGSSGSGVYSWQFNENKRVWERKVIGVFSGNRWKNYDDWFLSVRNFNVAVRITPDKYVQICNWMGKQGDSLCDLKRKKKL